MQCNVESHEHGSITLSIALPDQHPRLADGTVPDAGPPGHAGRHPRRRTGSPGGDGFRLGLVPQRLADRPSVRSKSRAAMPSGAANSRRRCRTCARGHSPAPASRSPATRCISNLGGDAALARLRERLRKRGLRLMLDFVPNHMGLDHPWVEDHPDYFIHGHRTRSGPRSAELHLGQTQARRSAARPRP